LHTKNQLLGLPGSALKVSVVGGVGGRWVPTHYQVKLQLILRLSWAVTIFINHNQVTDNIHYSKHQVTDNTHYAKHQVTDNTHYAKH
jgi:hypothetical protein